LHTKCWRLDVKHVVSCIFPHSTCRHVLSPVKYMRVDQAPREPERAVSDHPEGVIRLHGTIRLSADGLAKVLGDLEARVMRVVWTMDEAATARLIHEVVARDHRVAIHTVITVLNKLVEKGLLRREKYDDLLHFSARISEGEFRVTTARRVVEGILSFGPDAVTASFVDVLAEADPAQLTRLAELVRRRLEEERGR
jgi:predicted transcriptional regulator